jgi:hypothetical protein
MNDRPKLTREEAQKRYLEMLHAKPEAAETQSVPWDYKNRVKEAAEKALRAKNITRGVTVAAHKEEGKVAIIGTRQGPGPWQMSADCQVAWEDGLEPEQLGRIMVEEFEEKMDAVKRGEIS